MTDETAHLPKRCLARGCSGYPLFGFGSARKGVMTWACRDHAGLLPHWRPAAPAAAAPEEGLGGGSPETSARPSAQQQERLL